MLFNSYPFIFIFLPICFFTYFLLLKIKFIIPAKTLLVTASIFFYGYWNPVYIPLILISIAANYIAGRLLSKENNTEYHRKAYLASGILFNIFLLSHYKYSDFIIENINTITSLDLNLYHTTLPLGISFFTFTQIAFLVDTYKKEAKEYSLLNYMLFVTYFPHLLAGPILHHKEMMPQFANIRNYVRNHRNIALGLFIFSIGLFKKVIIADSLSIYANEGFSKPTDLNFFEAWITSLSYTFQLYFDFSAYTDMAIGVSLLFNIKLPINFNSPYKSLNIQDFWRRWHITLGRFLRDYIYIPLGGSKKGESKTYSNLMVTFLIGGLWHGAGWTFIFWGFLHGMALIVHRAWQKTGVNMNPVFAWGITFLFVNIAWVFFRSDSWLDAGNILKSMVNISTFQSQTLTLQGGIMDAVPWLIFALTVSLLLPNTIDRYLNQKPSSSSTLYKQAIFSATLFLISIYKMSLQSHSEFIYFNF